MRSPPHGKAKAGLDRRPACRTPTSGASFDSSPYREKIGLPAEDKMKMCFRWSAHAGPAGSSTSYRLRARSIGDSVPHPSSASSSMVRARCLRAE